MFNFDLVSEYHYAIWCARGRLLDRYDLHSVALILQFDILIVAIRAEGGAVLAEDGAHETPGRIRI